MSNSDFTPLCPVVDYCLSDGSICCFDLKSVPQSDLAAIGGQLVATNEKLQPPFLHYRYSWLPAWNGITFSIFFENKKVLSCALANERSAGDTVWQRLAETCRHYEQGWPELVDDPRNSTVSFDDPSNPPYYFKHGCPDLIAPGVKIARTLQVPFLATLLCPPWHRSVDQPIVELAFRLRNAVAVLILRSEWFEDRETRIAKYLQREASRPKPVKCKFDENNPDPWLQSRLSLDTNIHPLARRAMFHVCKSLLQANLFFQAFATLQDGRI